MADDTTKGKTVMERGTVLYIAANRGTHGIVVQDPGLMIFQRKFKGTKDISQDYHWCDALGEIDGLKDELRKIHAIAAYV